MVGARRDVVVVGRPRFHRDFLSWLARGRHPLRRRLRFRRPRGRLPACSLVVNGLQDPLRDLNPEAYAWLRGVEAAGVPVVNPADAHSRSRKTVQSLLLAEAGFDTPPVGPLGAFSGPVVVRSDVLHGAGLRRVASADGFDPAGWLEPVGSPFVETRSADGLYRKYRLFFAGDRSVPRHLQISADWCVRMAARDLGPERIAEELAYVAAPDPNHALLDRARRVLGLDVVAFDYSYRREGSVVVWEANPHPRLWHRSMNDGRYAYQRPAVERLYAVWAGYLLSRATGA